jgi:predicted RNA-binding Zn-ribbon protein involved in translation (DUF1610 family)
MWGTAMIFNCEKCGDVDAVLVDGYSFGDRLLEGVIFRVTRNSQGGLKAVVEPEFADYMGKMNAKKWIKECIRYVEEHEDDCAGQCPKCGDDIYLKPE